MQRKCEKSNIFFYFEIEKKSIGKTSKQINEFYCDCQEEEKNLSHHLLTY